MQRQIIVTGADGQLGRELLHCAPEGVDCLALGRGQLDITDADAISAVLEQVRPQALINTAAYTAVDRAESEPDVARRVNGMGPALLARACAAAGCRLLHLSTDFVFSGESGRPYRPASETGPLGEYGASKLAGELAVREALPGALIMRTGWVYSRSGNNFVHTMLRLMAERDSLNVVWDQVGTPTWARGLAQALWAAVDRPQLSGILHWSDAGVCSWYDFAVAIAEEGFRLGLLPRPVEVRPIPASEYPAPARRPAYSVLDKSESWRELGLAGVHWRVQLRAMLAELGDTAGQAGAAP